MLQAMKEEPPLNVKSKDKFLIQSILITPEKAIIPLPDLVRPFPHSPASRLIQFSHVIVDHLLLLQPEGRRDRKASLSDSKGGLSTPGRRGIYLDNFSRIA